VLPAANLCSAQIEAIRNFEMSLAANERRALIHKPPAAARPSPLSIPFTSLITLARSWMGPGLVVSHICRQ
jgi:hypothetical protein